MEGIKMKEFNLDEYLKDPSQKVVTRDGREVRILCTDRRSEFSIIALVFDMAQQEDVVLSFQKDGKYAFRGEQDLDLFFAPIKREGWVNIYRFKDDTRTIGCLFKSEEEANFYKYDRASKYIKTIKIEWEE